MKKNYIKPQFEIISLKVSAPILSGSVRGDSVSVSETPFDSTQGEDY
jgi:hypothetical protein